MAAGEKGLAQVRPNALPDTPQLHVDIDQARAAALGLSLGDVNSTLSTAWGGSYVNDFIDRDRVKRVFVQGDAQYRSTPEDLRNWYVRGSSGAMAPGTARCPSDARRSSAEAKAAAAAAAPSPLKTGWRGTPTRSEGENDAGPRTVSL